MAEHWGFSQIDINGLVFTSYNSPDWHRVAPIVLELRIMGVPVWYDYGLEAGTSEWGTQITRHIKKSGALIIFVTEGIFERDESYVIEEYEEAKMYRKPVIPVFLDDVVTVEFFENVKEEYARYITGWNRLQGVAYSSDAEPKGIAQAIKLRLDGSSEITYKTVPWVNEEAQRNANAEAARLASERRAEAERKRADAAQQAKEATMPATKVGSRIALGCYPQASDTPEPIIWRVLDVIDGKVMMISESLLDSKKYSETINGVTWENCSLRRWLNGEFLDIAFAPEERGKLFQAKTQTPDNPIYGTKSGDSTKDIVFCLSIEEAEKYFGGDEDRRCNPTVFARKNGCYVNYGNGMGWWWLRSPGHDGTHAAYVHTGGSVDQNGTLVAYDHGGVRPVVLARL